ncbi:MAG: substrate-binding periplasmic protein [Eggerthellaceae bacterium]
MKRSAGKIAALALVACLACALCGCASEPYVPAKKDSTVDPSALITADVLTVGVNANSAPFAMESDGSIVGIDVDVAASIADEMGLSLEVVDVGTDATGALENGTVDMVMGLDSADNSLDCWVSDPYMNSCVALFSHNSNSTIPTKKSKPSICADSASMSAWVVTDQYGSSALDPQDLSSSFEKLNAGETDYVAADAVVGTYATYASHYDAHIVALMEKLSGYCLGASSTNTALQSALQSALASFNEQGVLSVIENRWLGMSIDYDSISYTSGAKDAKASSSTQTESSEGVSGVGSNAVTF